MEDVDREGRTQETTVGAIQPNSLAQELKAGFDPRVYIRAFCTPPTCNPKEFTLNVLRSAPFIVVTTGALMGGLVVADKLSGGVVNRSTFLLELPIILAAGIAAGRITNWFMGRYIPFFRG